MILQPKLGMLVIVKSKDGDQNGVIDDIHMNKTRFWITLESQPNTLIEVISRHNGSWKIKSSREIVELTTQNEFHNYSLDKRAA
jgi:hypothetical protein